MGSQRNPHPNPLPLGTGEGVTPSVRTGSAACSLRTGARSSVLAKKGHSILGERGRRFSLSQRERAGVREKRPSPFGVSVT